MNIHGISARVDLPDAKIASNSAATALRATPVAVRIAELRSSRMEEAAYYA
jgi:hypothetical protein